MPPPQTWDILPHLHELLARVEAFDTSSAPLLSPEDSTPHDDGTPDIGHNYDRLPNFQPLNPKELPTAALQVKKKIRDAMKAVEGLPDVDRTVEEQREEIAELEDKIRRQREMILKIATMATEMEGQLGGSAS